MTRMIATVLILLTAATSVASATETRRAGDGRAASLIAQIDGFSGDGGLGTTSMTRD